MMEIKLCAYCGAYKLQGHTCSTGGALQRACADCEAYTPLSRMIQKADGPDDLPDLPARS
jgi:hypothetical protein